MVKDSEYDLANQNAGNGLVKVNSLRLITCQKCQGVGGLRKIIYGMPSEDFDFANFISGGCCPTELTNPVGCKLCNWVGELSDI